MYKTFQPTWFGKEIRQFDSVEYHGSIHGCLPPTTRGEVSKFIKALPQQALAVGSSGTATAGGLGLAPPTDKFLLADALKRLSRDAINDCLDEHDFVQDSLGINPIAVGSAIMSGITLVEKLTPQISAAWKTLQSFKKKPKQTIRKWKNQATDYLNNTPADIDQQMINFIKNAKSKVAQKARQNQKATKVQALFRGRKARKAMAAEKAKLQKLAELDSAIVLR